MCGLLLKIPSLDKVNMFLKIYRTSPALRYILFLILASSIGVAQNGKDFTKYVNPFIGTDAHGHTFPGAIVPFGMVQLSPDTRVEGWDACGGYHYSDTSILGFSHTHLSGTGIADYGDILVVPSVGMIEALSHNMRFLHEHESASPGYYSVMLEEDNIKAELTATARVGMHRYTFPDAPGVNIVIDLHHGLGPDRVIESSVQIVNTREITGMRRSVGWANNQVVYFVARFSKPVEAFGTIVNDTLHPRARSSAGKNVKAYVRFSSSKDEQIIVKVALSSVSVENARKNLVTEVPDWDFDVVHSQAKALWNKELGKIDVEGGTKDQLTTFYTALYHTMIAPNIYSDVDGRYRGMDGTIRKADGFDMHTVFSLWDTFRAEHPLLTIIDQKRTRDFVKSLIAKYKESGVLPVWELASNETWTMIGYHSVPVVVDAYMKGIRDFSIDTAYEAMKHSAMLDHFGLKAYREHGFIPGEMESESVSKTLEYAYNDWCIAQIANELGQKKDYDEYSERAQFYKNIFDPSTHFMRPKVNGMWVEPFNPASVTFHYTEANPWQYSFFAPHDIDGLIHIMGGKEKFVDKLDSLFKGGSRLAGRQQADITGMVGQYAQGNEPSHHVAYLYNYAGAPWKTQETVRHIVDSLFTATPDGLCGNDDCGQMSAWYVMSALGFYQVCPGQPIYSIGSPLFKRATIHLENGKQFIVKAEDYGRNNKYIQSAFLNDMPYSKSYFTHAALMNGGELQLAMGSRPNPTWASSDNDSPHSLPLNDVVVVPTVHAIGKTFADSTVVSLSCSTPQTDIYYTINGMIPNQQSSKYTQPIILKQTTRLKAIASSSAGRTSKVVTAEFVKSVPVGTLSLQTAYSHQYTGGGDNALIDGLRGAQDFRLGTWQGYEQNDLIAIVDLGKPRAINRIALGCLQDNNSWIFFPSNVEFSFSDDGKVFHSTLNIKNDVSPKQEGAIVKEFGQQTNVRARYIRIQANNMGVCPDWHKGAGGKAWLFVDEILVDAN